MKITVTISTDNAAFEDNEAGETARILRDLADKLERRGLMDIAAIDENGNKVGRFTVTE